MRQVGKNSYSEFVEAKSVHWPISFFKAILVSSTLTWAFTACESPTANSRIADIRFSPKGIYCELDESEKCGHIEFALTVPEIKEIIRNKRKKGWKLPDI